MLNYVDERVGVDRVGVPIELPADVAGEADFEGMATTMLTLAKRIRALFGLTLAEAGFHNGQDQLLMCLVGGEEMPVSALAHALDVRPSTVSKMVDRMADKGLIERRDAPLDGRVTFVCLTEKGIKAQAKIRKLWAETCRQVAAQLSREPATIARQLGTVSEAVGARLMRLR
jgi:DNA-binding MarR family transcriptional regulator